MSKLPKQEVIERLISEIVSKYKNTTLQETPQLQRQERKTMISEIKMLAQALLNTDKQLRKQKEKDERLMAQMQEAITDLH